MRTKTLLVIAAVGAVPSLCRAQDTAPAGACASIESDSERLACYDRALRAARAPAPSATPAAQATPPAPAAASTGAGTHAAGVGTAAATAGSAASTAGATPPTATPPPTQVNVQAPSSSISPVPGTSTPNAAAPSPQPAATVGSSAVPPAGVVPVIVLATRATPGRGVEFTTDKGDVWVQSDTRPLQLPPTPFNAQIKPGTLGSVFLVPENRLGIRVRRHD